MARNIANRVVGCVLCGMMALSLMMGASAESVTEASTEAEGIIEEAKKLNESRTGIQDTWTGPTDGPKAQQGKKIVCVNADSSNAIEAEWGESVQKACKRIGWECTVIDGKGTVQGQTMAINQAISMKVDGIVISADAEALQASIIEAENAGIPTVGIHATNTVGPVENLHLLYNICSDATETGEAMADYVIAVSEGNARVITLVDGQYAIARQKISAAQARLKQVGTIEILDEIDTPLSEVSSNMPQLASSWISQYGTDEPIYVIAIADLYYDFVTATLSSGNVDTDKVFLIGSDGTEAAYRRIRNGEYQVVTIPEQNTMFGYMAIDSLNRYFAGEEQFVWSPDVYLVTPDNVDKEGGTENQFIPSNGYADEYAKIWGVD